VGAVDGTPDGSPVGILEGLPIGTPDGSPVGILEGPPVGTPDGSLVGELDATTLGVRTRRRESCRSPVDTVTTSGSEATVASTVAKQLGSANSCMCVINKNSSFDLNTSLSKLQLLDDESDPSLRRL
jgi:hypothetical protein